MTQYISKKGVIAAILGSAMVLSLVAVLGVKANADTATTTSTTTTPATVFTRDLTIGSTGADVMALQKYLNANGYTVAATGAGSVGMESTYFGSLTRAAVAKLQAANSISPAAGYFGPLTRAFVNANGSTGTTGPCPAGFTCTPSTPIVNCPAGYTCVPATGTSNGSEGYLTNIKSIGGIDSSVQQNQNDVNVIGLSVDAKDSDITLNRVDADFVVGTTTNASSRLDNYIQSATVTLDGKDLQTIDASDVSRDNGVYHFRFSKLANNVIAAGKTGKIYVTVDAVSNVDSSDVTNDITVTVPTDGIRATDQAGVYDTYVASTDSITRTFNVTKEDTGSLTMSYDSNDNPTQTVQADENDQTNGVVLASFDIKAKSADTTIDSITANIATTTSTQVGNILNNVYLYADGNEIDSQTVGTGSGTQTVTFSNLDLAVNEDDTVHFEIRADVNNIDGTTFAEGAGVTVTLANTDVVAENASTGDSITPSGSVTGGTLTFRTEGASVDSASGNSATQTVSSVSTDDNTGNYTINFKVNAFGEDIYVPLAVSGTASTTAGAVYSIQANGADVGTGTSSAVLARTSGGDVQGDFVKVSSGSSATFQLQVSYNPASAGFYRAQLKTVNTRIGSATGSLTAVTANPVENFQTSYVNVQS